MNLKRRLLLAACLFSTVFSAFSQGDFEPTDYLSKEFHAGRREALRKIMPENSVMVVFAYPTRTFSNDVEYLYHQNPDMYYFTGYKEPNSVFLIFKEEQKDSAGKGYKEALFVQKRNKLSETWTGKRLGTEGANEKLGIRMALNAEQFKNFPLDFSKFTKIIYSLPDDMEAAATEGSSLAGLVASFRRKASLEEKIISQADKIIIQFVDNLSWDQMEPAKNWLKTNILNDSAYAANEDLNAIAAIKDSAEYAALKGKLKKKFDTRFDTKLYNDLTAKLREVKTPEEKLLLRKAVEISCQGHNEAMKAVHPNMSEMEIQGLQEFVHKKHGAEEVGYGSIIGSGENGCTLHYMTNTKTRVGNNLIVMDVGAEYHGYTADVTRTIPAHGKFSAEERAIYQIVYDAQEAAFKTLKDSSTWQAANKAANDVIAEGLLKLGIIKDKKDYKKYYPHGLGHHIGMDVHDRGTYGVLKKDMVITIEPGIYIPSDSDCDKKWWGLAVRIEDDALITQNGYELLSHFAPRSIEAVEKMIAEKSALDDFKLAPLKSGEKKAF